MGVENGGRFGKGSEFSRRREISFSDGGESFRRGMSEKVIKPASLPKAQDIGRREKQEIDPEGKPALQATGQRFGFKVTDAQAYRSRKTGHSTIKETRAKTEQRLRGEVREKVQLAYEASLLSPNQNTEEQGISPFRKYLAELADEDIIDVDFGFEPSILEPNQILARDANELRTILEVVNTHPNLSQYHRPQQDLEKRLQHELEHGEKALCIGFSQVHWIFTMKKEGPHGQYGLVSCMAFAPTKPITKLEYAAYFAAPGNDNNDLILNPSPGDIRFLKDIGYGTQADRITGVPIDPIEDIKVRINEYNSRNVDNRIPPPGR